MKLSVKQVFLHILLPSACFLFPIFFFFSQEKLLRFHVIANSDSQEDQAVKLKVKENILSFLSPSLSYADDKEEAKQIISSQMDEILSIAQTTLAENGFSYSAQAFLTYCEFPVKSYGDLVFPEPMKHFKSFLEMGMEKTGGALCILPYALWTPPSVLSPKNQKINCPHF